MAAKADEFEADEVLVAAAAADDASTSPPVVVESKTAEIVVGPFDTSRLHKGGVCVILGKRRSGVEKFAASLLSDIKSEIHVIGGASIGQSSYAKLPKVHLTSVETQSAADWLSHRRAEITDKKDKALTVLVLSDLGPILKNLSILEEIMKNSWTWHVLVVLECQYILQLPTTTRMSIDFTCIVPEPLVDSENTKLYNLYGGYFKSKSKWTIMIDTMKRQKSLLVIDKTTRQDSGVYNYYNLSDESIDSESDDDTFPSPVARKSKPMAISAAAASASSASAASAPHVVYANLKARYDALSKAHILLIKANETLLRAHTKLLSAVSI